MSFPLYAVGRAYSHGLSESVTRSDRRRRELEFESPSPPLASPCESTARLRHRTNKDGPLGEQSPDGPMKKQTIPEQAQSGQGRDMNSLANQGRCDSLPPPSGKRTENEGRGFSIAGRRELRLDPCRSARSISRSKGSDVPTNSTVRTHEEISSQRLNTIRSNDVRGLN